MQPSAHDPSDAADHSPEGILRSALEQIRLGLDLERVLDALSPENRRKLSELVREDHEALELLEESANRPQASSSSGPAAGGRFEMREMLGRGGWAEVFRVYDHELQREVARKQPKPEFLGDPVYLQEVEQRFRREASITSQLAHPAIVPIHDIGRDPHFYYTMQLIDGYTLRDYITAFHRARAQNPRRAPRFSVKQDRRSWTIGDLLDLLIRVGEGVAYAHEKSILHKDLKPENVMVGRFGEAYVLDWGLAKTFDPSGLSTPGESGGTSTCTLFYAPPELALGLVDQIDQRCDVYCLGAILFEILTGSPPFFPKNGKASHAGFLKEIAKGKSAAIVSNFAPDDLIKICARATAWSAADRYQTMRDLLEELRAFRGGRSLFDAGRWTRAKKWALRNRAVTSLSALLLVTLTAALIMWWVAEEEDARRVAAETFASEFASLPTLWTLEPGLQPTDWIPPGPISDLGALECTAPAEALPMLRWLLANHFAQSRDLQSARNAMSRLRATCSEVRLLPMLERSLLDPERPGALPTVAELTAVANSSMNPMDLALIGYVALRERKYDESSKYLTVAIEEHSDAWMYRDLRAIALLATRRNDGKLRLSDAVLDAEEVHRAVGRQTCRTLHVRAMATRDAASATAVAVGLWNECLALGGDQWVTLNQLADTELSSLPPEIPEESRVRRIEDLCKRALELRPHHKPLIMQAHCAELLREYDRGNIILDHALQQCPGEGIAIETARQGLLVTWVSALFREGRFSEAQQLQSRLETVIQNIGSNTGALPAQIRLELESVRIAMSQRFGDSSIELAINKVINLFQQYMKVATSPSMVIHGNLLWLLEHPAGTQASVSVNSEFLRQLLHMWNIQK